MIAWRLLLRGRGTDENILPRFAGKQSDVPLHILRLKRDPVDDHIKVLVSDRRRDFIRVCYIADDGSRTIQADIMASPIQEVQIPAPLKGQSTYRRADVAGSANK